MDESTRAVYEKRAAEWITRRSPQGIEIARAFGARTRGPTVDLGCGPGWYAPALAAPVLAVDVAKAMLDLAAERAPDAWRVMADLTALPLRRDSVGAAWASHSLMHIPHAELPIALASVHWSMRVGGRLLLRVPEGEGTRDPQREDDDFPGRLFSLWSRDALVDVIIGAGFAVEELDVHPSPHSEATIQLEATRLRTLPDLVGAGLRILVCGLNPSLYAADAGLGFARPGNRFWPAARQAGIVSQDRDPLHALVHHGVGFTDLVKRATVGAAELAADEYRIGLARLERLAAWLQPGVVAFVGLAGWRAAVDRRATAGPQERTLGGRPVYVMPSSSGLNAHSSVADLADHLRAAIATGDSAH